MKKMYKAYPTGGFAPTLENFWNYWFYITGKYYDYSGRENIFHDAEVLILGNPVELEHGKFIPNRYFGKIKNMGFFETYYLPEQNEMTFKQLEIIRWKPLSEEEIERLLKVTLHQCHWQEQQKTWVNGVINVYIEVEKVESGKSDMMYLQKFLYDFYYDFGKIEISEKNFFNSDNSEKFYLAENIYYDLGSKNFIKNGEKIFFSPYNAEDKKKFLDFLIYHSPWRISKEELFEYLQLTWPHQNRKLLELKRSLMETEFEKYLWLDGNFVKNNILIMEKNQWYYINPYKK